MLEKAGRLRWQPSGTVVSASAGAGITYSCFLGDLPHDGDLGAWFDVVML